MSADKEGVSTRAQGLAALVLTRTPQRMMRPRMLRTESARDDEPAPDKRLPPRQPRTKLLRTAARNPDTHRTSNAPEIQA